MRQLLDRTVTVVGGGVAGLSTACALTEAGLQVNLVERRSYLGGRASSHVHAGVSETIDNCQHVLFGCCTNLAGFYRRIGVVDRLHWTNEITMIEPGGRRSRLYPSFLPAPLHTLPSFLAARAFTPGDKLALGRAFSRLMRPIAADSRQTLGSWLTEQGQTNGALERFWRLVIASALNADLDSIGLPYAAKVIRELFMNSAEAGRMGLSTVPLGELYAHAAEFLGRAGSTVSLNSIAESASWDADNAAWTLTTSSGVLKSGYLVLALPFEAMGKLIPFMPPADGSQQLTEQIRKLEHWPICSVHLWFDRDITDLEHAVLLDRQIHWMYNKGRLQSWRKCNGSYLELVVSASRTFAALSNEEAIKVAVEDLAEFFPTVRIARLEKAVRIKEMRATFGVTPGIDESRPSVASPWPSCFLAGDWIATGWPSTMESAARSGHLAAEAICRGNREPRVFLEADLKPKGLMRLTASGYAGYA